MEVTVDFTAVLLRAYPHPCAHILVALPARLLPTRQVGELLLAELKLECM
jgi:hypothetical protein